MENVTHSFSFWHSLLLGLLEEFKVIPDTLEQKEMEQIKKEGDRKEERKGGREVENV